MKSILRLTLPQELAATTLGLIYLAFPGFRCRYRAERLGNRAGRDVENPWTLFADRSRRQLLHLSLVYQQHGEGYRSALRPVLKRAMADVEERSC